MAMKRQGQSSNLILKNIGIVLLLLVVVNSGKAQSSKEDRQQAKRLKKEEQRKIALENTEKLIQLFENQEFVLEANTLYNRSGQSFQLSSTINFVGFDGKNSTIQLGFDHLIGWNGVGGVTIDGSIQNMEIKKNKKGAGFSATATVRPKSGGLITLNFRVGSDANARVDMTGAFGDRLSFQGQIVRLDETRVYKGTALY
jgi:hypothetical protein